MNLSCNGSHLPSQYGSNPSGGTQTMLNLLRPLVSLRKCNSKLQYYKIDYSFSIKLQEIKLRVCEEYKTERDVRNKIERSAMFQI